MHGAANPAGRDYSYNLSFFLSTSTPRIQQVHARAISVAISASFSSREWPYEARSYEAPHFITLSSRARQQIGLRLPPMGNASTKEHRPEGGASGNGQPSQMNDTQSRNSRPRGRSSRSTDLSSLLGIAGQSVSGSHGAPERRETRQEREARRLERERQARIVERERSLREEHVDGGYLVTLGTYVGPEDFNKSIVRQLQVRLWL